MPIRKRISDPTGFQRRLKELREVKNLTFAALGRAAGVSGTCVWNWENGNTFPRAVALAPLAKALETTGVYLVEGRENGSSADFKSKRKPDTTVDLSETIRSAREAIAAVAGIGVVKVRVILDYDD